mgnify:CR=1 FL=1
MHESMGNPVDDEWRLACEAAFSRRINTDSFVAFVVEAEGAVVSSGAGWIEEHLPSPYQLDARKGYIASMSTGPDHLRQGHAKTVFEALLAWFAEHDIKRIDLRATQDGEPLYAAFGFRVLGGTTMGWFAPGGRPGLS